MSHIVGGRAEIGRQARLRAVWETMRVRVSPTAPKKVKLIVKNYIIYI